MAAGRRSSSARKAYAHSIHNAKPPVKRTKVSTVISFFEEDLEGVQTPHDDALVITLRIGNFDVRRILVEGGSSTDILFYEPYMKMEIGTERLVKVDVPLYGFTGVPVPVDGFIELPVRAGSGQKQSTILTNFLIVKIPSTYNGILGRPSLNRLQAIVSTVHLKIKFPTAFGIGKCRGDQVISR